MSNTLLADGPYKDIPSTSNKALRINLNKNIYGSFAEIGAGQETVRHFFRAGGASGTIAKTMSAYDKNFSDAIYGEEPSGRYVTEERLQRMLRHEMQLLEERITRDINPNKLFFSYANTVATIDFSKKYKGHGWLGIHFQIRPDQKVYNEIVLHVRFHENEAIHQQNTLGVVGANLIHGAFYHYDDPKQLIRCLYDNIDQDSIEIDTINFSGPDFAEVDNRLMSLVLLKNGMTEAVMFGPDGKNILPASILYKKNILAFRGSFRPITKVGIDIYKNAEALFLQERRVVKKNTEVIFEITLSNLGADGAIDEADFMDRAKLLSSLGYTVLLSNFKEYYKLVEYFARFTKMRIGLAMGVSNLIEVFDQKYYKNLGGGILEASGKLFSKDMKVYLYPMLLEETNEVINSEKLDRYLDPNILKLYQFFREAGRIVDIENYNEDYLKIFSKKVLKMIENDEEGWEKLLPEGVPDIIKEQCLFSCVAIPSKRTTVIK
ncbi:MAG TPA: hypothetical protein VKX30_02490 [Flavobacteriaceae bacterium]|nr:hypothetical protein [Flavobacteriaceae bacterium]